MPMPIHMIVEGAKQGVIEGDCKMKGREGTIEIVALEHDIEIPTNPQDGKAVGKRVSAIGFDFDTVDGEPTGTFPLVAAGAFGDSGSTLEGTLVVSPDHPRNPYRHKFHPDHDNLDARYIQPVEEAFSIQREVRLT